MDKTVTLDKGKKKLVRTKNVFGKKLSKTNLLILMVLVCLLVFAAYKYVTGLVDEDIAGVVAETNKYNKDYLDYYSKNIDNPAKVAEYSMDQKLGELPLSYNHDRTIDDIRKSLWAADISANSDPVLISEDDEMPFKTSSNFTKAAKLELKVTISQYSDVAELVDTIYANTRIYYIHETTVSYNSSANTYNLVLVFYTFYEAVNPTA